MTRWIRGIVVALVYTAALALCADPIAPLRPTLSDELVVQVEALRADADAALRAFLIGEVDSLDAAIDLASQIKEIRRAEQTGWADFAGNDAEWYEVSDARRHVERLQRIGEIPVADRRALVKIMDAAPARERAEARGALAAVSGIDMRQVAAFEQILGPDDLWTLAAKRRLGGSYRALGQLEKSYAVLSDAKPIATGILGDTHPETLRLGNELTVTLLQRGRLEEAVSIAEGTLAHARYGLGETHPITATSLANLGSALRRSARYAFAEVTLIELLALQQRTLGETDERTLRTLGDLAGLLHEAGRLRDADASYRAMLQGMIDALGNDHPVTISGRNNYTAFLIESGQLAAAEPMLRDSVASLQRIRGDAHPSTLATRSNLAALLKQQGRLADAEPLYRDILSQRRQLHGENHPRTLGAMSDLAALFRAKGKLDDATMLERDVYGRYRIKFGPRHPSTAAAMSRLADTLYEVGETEEARTLFVQAYETERATLGAEHPQTIGSMFRLGAFYRDQGRLDDAEPLLKSAMDLNREILGPEHPSTLAALHGLARLYEAQDRMGEAEQMYRDALDLASTGRAATRDGGRGQLDMTDVTDRRHIMADLCSVLVRRDAIGDAWTATEHSRGRALVDVLARSRHEIQQRLEDRSAFDAASAHESEQRTALAIAEASFAALESERGRTVRDASLTGTERAVRISTLDTQLQNARNEARRLRRDVSKAEEQSMLALQVVMPELRSFTFDQMQSKLEPNDVILAYVWGRDVMLLVATPTTACGYIIARGSDETADLADTVHAIRNTLAQQPENGARELPRDEVRALLNRILPGDVHEFLAPATRMVILCDGPMHDVPLDALCALVETSPLNAETQSISYASSATSFLTRRELAVKHTDPIRSALVAVGAPRFSLDTLESDKDLTSPNRGIEERIAEARSLDLRRQHGGVLLPLAETRTEVERIAAIVDDEATAVLTGSNASLAQLESTAGHARYLHIATHGLVGSMERPYVASLALTRPATLSLDDIGFLTLDHLIRNWGTTLEGCELVTLSACDTRRSVQKGDAVLMSLPWGFYYAGAPTVVTSLWHVEGDARGLLMSRFYENLLGAHDDDRVMGSVTYPAGEPMPKARALQEAKRWLRSYDAQERGAEPAARVRQGDESRARRPYEHPHHWAGFVLLGDPG